MKKEKKVGGEREEGEERRRERGEGERDTRTENEKIKKEYLHQLYSQYHIPHWATI